MQVVKIVGAGQGKQVEILVDRDGQKLTYDITPVMGDAPGKSGAMEKRPLLGISSNEISEYHRVSPVAAVWAATEETARITGFILTTIGQMFTGDRSAKEVGSILRIGKIAGDTAQESTQGFLTLIAMISINLGLINLFPIPLLDGGHLAFYGIEAIRGRPLSPRVQDIALRIGLAAVAGLMLFAVWNDLEYFRVIAFFKNLVS
jgi:regulator of sigma E protease